MGLTSISMAMDEFYAFHSNYTTRLVLHLRDSKNDVVLAASEVVDLLQNEQVQVIIGPQKSSQALFISDLGNKAQVPIISFSATSPALSFFRTPYFLRATLNDSAQVSAISSLTRFFSWREVVLVYEDTAYGRDLIPYLADALEEINTKIPYRSVITLSATDDQVKEELYKLMTMQTRVFIVHMSGPMGARLFSIAKELGMMSEGYAWIMTDGLTNIVDSFDSLVLHSMQGALGVKPYVPSSKKLSEFSVRWKRRYIKEYPNGEPLEPSIFGLWAYDTVWALAMAVEKANGSCRVFKVIQEEKFNGVSGEFHLVDGELKVSTLQVVNIVGRGGRGIGFWTPEHGLRNSLSSINGDLSPVIWPGESTKVPKGWDIPVSGKKLRIGVPLRDGFYDFVKVEIDNVTNAVTVTGFCIDVFEAVVKRLPYAISHEYIPFVDEHGQSAGTYNDLVYQVYLQKYDAAVGDITIRANRSLYVDFTLPYTESGVAMLVPVKESNHRNGWIFLKPLTVDLWLGTMAFFFYTGFVIWAMEHRINTEFRGPPSQQLGTMIYFSFSTLVFAHREKVENILSKLVLIIWLFVVLILTSSYTASLTSIITVQQLQPSITDVQELLKNGDYVGCHNVSFIEDLLKQLHFDKSKIRSVRPEDYVDALTKGSQNGGVSAIIHEIPYIKLFLAQHCKKFTMVGPIYKTAGFGFVFPKGSPLVDDVSEEILNIIEGDEMEEIERKWFGDLKACSINAKTVNSANLTFQSFSGLFIITGAASTCALLIFLALFLSKNWKELKNLDSDKTAWQRLMSLWEYYNKKDLNSHSSRRNKVSVNANDRNYDSHQESPGVETQTVSGHGDAKTNEPEEISCSELTSPNSDAVLAVVPQ
ncbi:glutamate receptor 2.9-like isoform X1 [Dioscorea cayenensis subsp. rotundata]|uniref:Glutamate receptor n=1 Tax=Dioscorea cayennensis subsp. rotundata TaxID=55577 RepID=A0AB40BS80_DIOCR|nr:glutamate receptor 2.9-like isoform X1 [Dioscorea cayenensis subsp. rotundata]